MVHAEARDLRHTRAATGSGRTQQREAYDRGNGATILLRDETRDTVLLTRQFRLPAYLNGHPDGMLLEAPAGLLDGDDTDAETAIRREAEEETGYRVDSVTRLGEYFMSPGSVTERVRVLHGHLSRRRARLAGRRRRERGRGHRDHRGRRSPRRSRWSSAARSSTQDRAAAPAGAVRIASRDVTAPETPFADAVDAFLREAPTAFSTPGHKRNPALIGDDPLLANDAPMHGGADDLRGSKRHPGARRASWPRPRSAPSSAASRATARRTPTRRSASRSPPRASR